VLFRNALGATDPASRFLGLYQILALLNGDNQGKIDDFILAHQRVPVTKSRPLKAGGFADETIYTRLRNEYMHVRPNVALSATRAEIVANLDNLISLVRTAIEKV
jgi:hypothetical protein